MELRSLEMTIISAKDIKNVKHISTMDVYVEARISSDPSSRHRTPVAKDGGTRPTWNFPLRFTVDANLAFIQSSSPTVFFKLRCTRHVRGDKDIGEVHVPVMEPLALSDNITCPKNVNYPVLDPSGKPKGELNLTFPFGSGPPDWPVTVSATVPYKETPPLGYPMVGPEFEQPPSKQEPPPKQLSVSEERDSDGEEMDETLVQQVVEIAYMTGYNDGLEAAAAADHH